MADAAPPLTATEAVAASALDPDFLPLMLAHRERDTAAGIPFRLTSTRRSYDYQAELYARAEKRRAEWEAGGRIGPAPKPAAKPGTSKHELGFAYDYEGPRTESEWGRSTRNAEALGLEAGERYTPRDRGHIEAPEAFTRIRTAVLLRVASIAAAIAVAVAVLGDA